RPVPFGDVLEDGRAPAKDDEWKQVRGTGTYLGDVRMVRNRPGPGGDFGYETVDVFAVDGIKVLVDRGWVTNGSSAAKPSS
ncbi:SURF1 family protein, partial [Xanthomonas citri pv. citri]|nr:SURF1 family protein [Xanthomonas citri pv. citri]